MAGLAIWSGMHEDPVLPIKRQLVAELVRILDGQSQLFAGADIGADQSTVSRIRSGKLERFSIDTLVRYLDRVTRRVVVTVEWNGRGGPRIPRRGTEGRPLSRT